MKKGKELIIDFVFFDEETPEKMQLLCPACGGWRFGANQTGTFIACADAMCRTIIMVNVKDRDEFIRKSQSGELKAEILSTEGIVKGVRWDGKKAG